MKEIPGCGGFCGELSLCYSQGDGNLRMDRREMYDHGGEHYKYYRVEAGSWHLADTGYCAYCRSWNPGVTSCLAGSDHGTGLSGGVSRQQVEHDLADLDAVGEGLRQSWLDAVVDLHPQRP